MKFAVWTLILTTITESFASEKANVECHVTIFNGLKHDVDIFFKNSNDEKETFVANLMPHSDIKQLSSPGKTYVARTANARKVIVASHLLDVDQCGAMDPILFRVPSFAFGAKHCGIPDQGRGVIHSIDETGEGSQNRFTEYPRLLPEDQVKRDIRGDSAYSRGLLEQRKRGEKSRIYINRNQPQRVPSFTDVGFKVMKAPDKMWSMIHDYYTEQLPSQLEVEEWPDANTYVNHWSAPTYMVRLPEEWQPGGKLKREIFQTVQPILESWSGRELQSTDLYGIRVYSDGSVLNAHVDRVSTHAVSAIINVDQDVFEDWPLEIYDHNGRAHNISIEPGNMILYESAKCIHSRPFPFNGHSFANVFVHFRPKHDWNFN